ncbi:MAG: HK97 family phage prohead protease [Oscillospiraceae bacterium]|nr:HK97 family phage prohead protease [Oscillospiraceae bacterium]
MATQMMTKQPDREYRNLSSLLAPPTDAERHKRLDSNFYVEGYAAKFERFLLWEYNDSKYYEELAPGAFDHAEMSDVIMQYDHQGKVLARLTNSTLGIDVDETGLFMFADLSKSTAAKELYEEITVGLITRMSWAFTVEDVSVERLDEHTYLRTITQIKKVYDVSAVSIPANDDTEILARSFVAGNIEAEQRELVARQARILTLKIKMEV